MTKTLAILAALALAGCASYKVKGATGFREPLGQYKSVQIVVEAEEEGSRPAVDPFRTALVAELVNHHLFENYLTSTDPGQAEIKIVARLSGLHEVSETAQLFVGTMAGRGKLTASVQVLGIPDSRFIGSFRVDGKSDNYAADTASTAGGIQMTAQGVADQLEKRK